MPYYLTLCRQPKSIHEISDELEYFNSQLVMQNEPIAVVTHLFSRRK